MSPTVADVHDAFIAFEEEAGLWDAAVDGVTYWHQIRYGVFGRLLRALDLMTGARAAGRPPPKVQARHFTDVFTSRDPRWRLDDLTPADLLVYAHPRPTRRADGSVICQYTEPLLEGLPYSRWVIKTAYRKEHHGPNHTPGLRFLDRAVLAAEARQLARGRVVTVTRGARREVARWGPALDERFGCRLDRGHLRHLIREACRVIPSLEALYGDLLDRVRPKAVVQVIGYSSRILPLTAVARRRGIPVVEMQHGTIGPTHLAYNFAPGREPPGVPDVLAGYSGWWGDLVRLPARCRVVGVGNAWLDDHLPETLRDPRPPADGPRIALCLSQASIGALMSRWAADAAPKLAERGWRLRYKFHPAEIEGWRGRYPWLAEAVGPGLEVIDRRTALYDEMAGVHAQIGVYSTALFEGVAFHLPTVVAAIPGYEALQPLIDAEAAALCPDAASLADTLTRLAPPDPAARHRIWTPGARENFRALLAELV